MFYSSFELRNQTEYCTPKGPNFKRAPLVKFSVNGTNIKLRIPRHRTKLPSEPRHARKFYDLEKLHLDYCIRSRPEWRALPIAFRVWDFYGPWFTGRLAGVDMFLSIITPGELKENQSLFHPRAFEGALAGYLTYRHGSERGADQKGQAWFAPVNWSPITHLPCIAASFDVVENNQGFFLQGGRMRRYLCLPITDKHILCLSFSFSRSQFFPNANEPYKDVDEWVNIAPMKALTENVMNSLQISLSPAAQAQQAKALSGLADASLVKEFPPLNGKNPGLIIPV